MTLYLTESEYRVLWPDPDPLYVDDEPWPLYTVTPPRHIPWRWLALAVLFLAAWRRYR